jgi:hypothetical protein
MSSAQLNHPTPTKPTVLNGPHLSSDKDHQHPAIDTNGLNNNQQHYTPSVSSGLSTPASTASPGPVSADVYFASHVAPKSLPENAEKIRAFVDHHMHEGRRVVLVTVSSFLAIALMGERERWLFGRLLRQSGASLLPHYFVCLDPVPQLFKNSSTKPTIPRPSSLQEHGHAGHWGRRKAELIIMGTHGKRIGKIGICYFPT